MISTSELVQCALRLQEAWGHRSIQFCFIGGLAVQRWGEPRFTRAVDVSIFVGFGNEREAAKQLLTMGKARIENPVEFAVLNRVLLLEDESGCPIDIALAAMPFESEMIARAEMAEVDPARDPLRLCSATDLVILKVFAGRAQDWLDVRGVLIRSADCLDWQLIEQELGMLLELKEEMESLDRLLSLRSELF